MLQAQIFIDKDDMRGDILLYKFILRFLLENEIVGATAYEGIAGFGHDLKMKNPTRIFSFDESPIIITFIDEEDKVKEALQKLRLIYNGGLIITHVVEQW